MNLRDEVLDAQLKLSGITNTNNLPLMLGVWRETEGRPLVERYAELGAARLRALRFIHTPDEPLIGRIEPLVVVREEWEKAAAGLRDYFPATGGQTGHCEPFYDDLFRLGLDGLREKAKNLSGFVIAADGISAMSRNAAEQAVDPEVAAACNHIANGPPRTFREALQLMWFVMVAIQIGDGAGLVGPGRLDRRLIRFYEADIAAGRLTREEALEMIETLYLFINNSCKRGLAYAVMICGDDVCNELSYLALEALRRTRLVYPGVGVCWNAHTPPALRKLAVELIADGISNVAIFNDDLIKKAMVQYGVPSAEAGEYINSTCVEITPCGASNVYVASPYFPLCTILLEYMENAEAATYEEFRSGYFQLLGEKIDAEAAVQNDLRKLRFQGTRRPIQSLFTRDCIGRRLDIEEGGALYNWVECSFVGLANLTDSLLVIRREVYESGNLSLPQLRSVLKQDFAGKEALRQRFLNAHPKYGNADPEVDGEIPVITQYIIDKCAEHKMFPDGSPFIPGTFCWEKHQRLGKECGATPDGRRAGFPFADGAGPAQGREKNGPTSAISSVCFWNHQPMLGGSAFNQRYTAAATASPEARGKLEALIDTFIRCGGFETQINILDAEKLKAARLHPEEYRDLVVRIGGYTDYFTGLSPEMQAEVITRTIYSEP